MNKYLFSNNLLGCPCCTNCKENEFQSAGARQTAIKPSTSTAPATCRNMLQKSLFLVPKMFQNRSKNAAGRLSEAACAPRSTQEQQTATKNWTKHPRAAQERPTSAPKRLEGPDGGSARLRAGLLGRGRGGVATHKKETFYVV